MRRVLPLPIAALLVLLALCGSASGSARFFTPSYGSGPPEVIGGFQLGDDGSLAPIPGSPFPGGDGGLWGFAFTPDGTAAVSGFYFTGGVQGYSVLPSGVFSLANTVPTASATGVAVTPDGRFAYAGTREFMGVPGEGIRRFSVGAGGTLMPLTPNAGGTDEYGDIAISPDGRFLFAAQFGNVQRFSIGSDGSLTPLGSTPTPLAMFMAVSPDGSFLFLETFDGVATFAIGPDGQLKEVGPSVAVPGSSMKIFSVAPDGRHVYLPDYNSDVIFTIAIAEGGAPTIVGETPVENPEMVSVSPDGRFLVFYEGGGSEDGLGVAAIGPDGVPTVLPLFVPWVTYEPERLTFQPQPTPVARFTATPAVVGEATQFNAGASERAVRYDWSFGDGTILSDGGPTPSHSYAEPGTYEVTLAVTDAQGCSLRHVYTGQSTLCPGGAPARTVGAVTVPAKGLVKVLAKAAVPVIDGVRVSPRKFAPKMRGVKAGKVKLGTTFRYTVSEDATVRFKIERKTLGRLVGGKCRPRTSANAARKKCPLFKKLGSREQAGKAGANQLPWNGKLHGRPLPPGPYRATAVATDAAGGRSLPKRATFRVLPLPPLR